MDKSESNILDISHNYYKYLMNLQNVNGVGLGFKEINGITTKEPCIHVLVENKIHSKYITQNNIVPKNYMGIKTDVIEVGKINTHVFVTTDFKIRPLKGGCVISIELDPTKSEEGHFDSTGTLGCIVTRKKRFGLDYFILSNNHIIADSNNAPKGTPIFQPQYNSGVEEEIAYLSEFIKVYYKSFRFNPINYVDAAIAKIKKKSLISDEIFGIGRIKGAKSISNFSLEELKKIKLKKVGMTTGLTEGKVKTIGSTIEIAFNSPKNIAIFKDTIVAEMYSKPGDSGACVLDQNNEVIGLLMGGHGPNTFINDIEHVLNLLHVDIYTSSR